MIKLGLPLAAREKELASAKPVKPPRTKDIRFQGKSQTFPIVRVRLEMPKYRLENGRTSAAQRDFIAKNKLPVKFFDVSKSENSDVQFAQHKILLEMAHSSDPDRDLFSFFAKRDQEDPLIIDCRGFVVNGNRRLCVFREINVNSPARFTHIDVIVLPECDPQDIDELEVHLQVEKDIKQEYSWISLAYTLRQKLDTGKYNENQLAEIFGMAPPEIKQSLKRLTLADDYLTSRGKEGQYLELEKAQFAFEQLEKSRPKLDATPSKQKLFAEIAYRLIDSPQGGRLYATIPSVVDVIDDIKDALEAELLGKQIEQHRKKIASNTDNNDLLGPINPQESDYLAAFMALRESKKQDQINTIIQNAIETQRERERAKKRGQSALEAVRKANTALADALNLLDGNSVTEGIPQQLDMIEKNVKKLRDWLAKKK